MVLLPRGTPLWRVVLHHCLHMGEAPGPRPPPHATGLADLDAALGGGLPLGRLALIQGAAAAGKTELCLKLTADAQEQGHDVAWLDLDHTFSPAQARARGLDDNTLVAACTGLSRAVAMATALVKARHVSWLVLDPWPPAPCADLRFGALLPLARAAADTEAVVLVTQGSGDRDWTPRDAMRYVCTTVMMLGARENRIVVTKKATNRPNI